MKRTAPLLLLAVALLTAAAYAAPAPTPSSVAQLFAQNLALGDFSQGRPTNPESAARIQDLLTQGLSGARALVAANAKSADARNLLGLFLTAAYRPLPAVGEIVALRRGSADPAEIQRGLHELRAAIQLQPKRPGLILDYAWALLLTGQRAEAKRQLQAVITRFPALSPEDRSWLTELQGQIGGVHIVVPAPKAEVPKAIIWVSFEDGLAAARREKKRVLVDFMAEWCGWCKRMDADTFSKPEVIALSRDFVFARVDGDKDPALARRYRITGFPTVVVMDAEGKEAERLVGYKSPQEFMRGVQ